MIICIMIKLFGSLIAENNETVYKEQRRRNIKINIFFVPTCIY